MKQPDASLIDLKLLRLFDTLYECRSVSRCAQQLEQSQPTISIWLARLREQLGDALFVRTHTGMQPTPRADELIGTCRDALALIRQMATTEAAFDPSRAVRTFRICMTDASHATLLPALFAQVSAAAPHVNLEAIRIDHLTFDKLQSGEADLALGYLPELESGFYQQTLYQQNWLCLVRQGHPQWQGALSAEQYAQAQHVVTAPGQGHQRLEHALREQGIERTVRVRLPGFLGLPALLLASDLIATVPELIGRTLARSVGLQALPCPIDLPRFPVKQHWHTRYHQDAGNRWLRNLCAQLFQHQGGIIE
ncbi:MULTISPECIES: LysR family transcriptional regulator [unclassified Pseudomonas]|uniref:LysR family transcriptional regulator n=1 Tax=unclassified Pseudomonas TaxID=196821 RepID=UPI000BCCD6FA|nr:MULTISPECIES: LysR family transcriptional regulator [unclassified Pseudomonas]PVZ20443.1 DNA-binding transcriptional LysR family regulator [Pseudomonas sp. URIL14HWK12:I12]PVZ27509.1 DNA-binding transcriptional LysR family regulator [Pseudomonas sp. URIL14HWK12:I10]PVZ38398.1 DNA-binding transcriptional LysR family regulator [Pseudomonas sp. URIL14HWK12:I11]SNZ03516.1 transcriptional regulator, LysR family [Pseudomonas sp. URIL14HWK12:I9]